MSSPRLPLSSRPSFLPDEISRREFATVFRGYDPAEVRTFLNQLAEQSAEHADRIAEIQRSLAETAERVKNPELDEETVTKLLGEQTAQILRSAREAANDTRSKAEAEVSRQLREAHEVTTKMREEAETILAERTDEAERMAESVRNEAAEAAASMRAEAESDAAQIRSEVATEAEQARANLAEEIAQQREQANATMAAEQEQARQSAHDLIETARAEAQGLINRVQEQQAEMVEGLVRKRKIALAQVEELRAGRQRLLKAYKMVRGTLDEVTQELERVEEEARQSASMAGMRAAQQAEIQPEDLDTVVELEHYTLQDDVSDNIINLIDGTAGGRADDGTGAAGVFDADAAMEYGEPATENQRITIEDAELLPEEQPMTTGSGQVTQGGTSSGGAQASTATLNRQEIMPLDVEVVDDEYEDDLNEDDLIDDEDDGATQQRPRSSSFIIGESSVTGAGATLDANMQVRRDAAVSKARSQAVRRLKRALQDEQDALLARLRNDEENMTIESLLGSVEDQSATYHRAVVKLFREVVRTGASSVEGSTGVERGVVDRTGTTAARAMATELVEDLRSQLEPVLDELLAAEEMVDGSTLGSLVGAPYRVIRGDYLDQLVEDRISGAFDQGMAIA